MNLHNLSMKMRDILYWVFVIFTSIELISIPCWSNNPKIFISPNKTLVVEYASPSWNKNPTDYDFGQIVIKDSNSGKLVQVQLQESGLNTSLFRGYYKINFELEEEFSPEIYIPPQGMLKETDGIKKIERLVKERLLVNKPFLLKNLKSYQQILTIFDTREQAFDALNDFRKNQAGVSLVDKAALESQRQAQALREKMKQVEEAQALEKKRIQIEEEERLKQQKLKEEQARLKAEEIEKRKMEAKSYALKAMSEYKKENYSQAGVYFEKAVSLDPDNTTYYYQYGVALFKTEQYSKSLAILNLVQDKDVNPLEKKYYVGLNYSKMKDHAKALMIFKEIKEKDDPNLSPSASFFAGLINFQIENYDEAKIQFEYVVEKSSDPRLDQQADSYIEQIANIKMFEANKKKKIIYTINLGLMYDSNILSVSQSLSPTNLAGFRGIYGGSLEYRPIYSERHEWSAILNASDMYSTDASFKPSTSFQNTDPLSLSFALPYKYKGILFKMPYQLGVTPSYETIQMNADATGSREGIVYSQVIKIDQTFIPNESWFSSYMLELRSDQSLLPVTSTDEVQTANKYSFLTTNTLFKNKKKTEAAIYEIGFSINNAQGKNVRSQKIDLAGSYLMPFYWETSFIPRLALSQNNYPDHAQSRKDSNIGLSLNFRKPLTEALSWNLSLGYNQNNSNLETNTYNKYTLTTTMGYSNSL